MKSCMIIIIIRKKKKKKSKNARKNPGLKEGRMVIAAYHGDPSLAVQEALHISTVALLPTHLSVITISTRSGELIVCMCAYMCVCMGNDR